MTVAISNGSQCTSGPNCCADPCLYDRLHCDAFCCKTVPRVLCVVFTPDELFPCQVISLFIGHLGLGTYFGSILHIFGDGEAEFTISLEYDQGTGICSWRFVCALFYVDEVIQFDGQYVTCHEPNFSIRLEDSVCPGTLAVTRYDLARVPFVGQASRTCTNTAQWIWDYGCDGTCDWHSESNLPGVFTWAQDADNCTGGCVCAYPQPAPTGLGQFVTFPCRPQASVTAAWRITSQTNENCCTPDPPAADGTTIGETAETTCDYSSTLAFDCGDCATVCKEICVIYEIGGVQTRRPYEWDPATERYVYSGIPTVANDFIYLTYDGYTCNVELAIPDLTNAGYEFDPFPLTDCGAALNIQIPDIDNTLLVKVACKPCTCWFHLCDSCRCACNELCMHLYQYGVLEILNLPWFFDELTATAGWTDGYFTVSLDKNPVTGACRVTVPGFDPVDIEDCGTALQFQLEDLETGDMAFGGCKTCVCFGASPERICCEMSMNDVPLIMYATIENVDVCPCAGNVITLVWNPIEGLWQGFGAFGTTGTCAEQIWRLILTCDASALELTIDGECVTLPLTQVGYGDCDPMYVQYTMPINAWVCCGVPVDAEVSPEGSVLITITE